MAQFIDRMFDRGRLKQSLSSDDEVVQRDAIYSLESKGRIRDPQLLLILIRCLKAESGNNSLAARRVIELVRPDWQTTEEAHQLVPEFIGALDYKGHGYTRFGAVYALGKIRDRRAVAPLKHMVTVSSGDIVTKGILALGEIGDSAAVDLLVHVLSSLDVSSPRGIKPNEHAAAA